jgi:hypothetical protein
VTRQLKERVFDDKIIGLVSEKDGIDLLEVT